MKRYRMYNDYKEYSQYSNSNIKPLLNVSFYININFCISQLLF